MWTRCVATAVPILFDCTTPGAGHSFGLGDLSWLCRRCLACSAGPEMSDMYINMYIYIYIYIYLFKEDKHRIIHDMWHMLYTCAFCACRVCIGDAHNVLPSSKANCEFTHRSTACVRQSQIQSLPGRGFWCADDVEQEWNKPRLPICFNHLTIYMNMCYLGLGNIHIYVYIL